MSLDDIQSPASSATPSESQSADEKRYAFSSNGGFKNKPDANARVNRAMGWTDLDLDADLMAGLIQKGRPISAQYKDGYKTSANFRRCGFIAVDIDKGTTVEQASANDFVKRYASFLYTTVNHRADHHRFRVVFVLEDEITEGQDWADALLGLAEKLNGDLTIRDAARMFCGNEDAEIHWFGKGTRPGRGRRAYRCGPHAKAGV